MFRVKSSRREQRVAQAICVSRLLLLDTGNVKFVASRGDDVS
jgi:hypothetical protein